MVLAGGAFEQLAGRIWLMYSCNGTPESSIELAGHSTESISGMTATTPRQGVMAPSLQRRASWLLCT
jgi:hypothetical protein